MKDAPALAHLRIALIGNPNCGKTSLFNALTGSRQKVANYPGVTVESKIGSFNTPKDRAITLVDLPGTYSLRARSPDEIITRAALLAPKSNAEKINMILCVADATNLRLSLRLVLELKQTGIPVMLVLNMMDLAKARCIKIDIAGLEKQLAIKVIPATAIERDGTQNLLEALDAAFENMPSAGKNIWQAQSAADLRLSYREVTNMMHQHVLIPKDADKWTRRIDQILLHPVLGMIILLGILFVVFQAVFYGAAPAMELIAQAFDGLAVLVKQSLPNSMLSSLLADGIIAGVGSVLVFLPQILILFFFILILEDFGYMARAAFLIDRIIGATGLHGRSFIPLISSFACAIPGIMAARVIDNPRQRLATILIAPLMTCSARIPVYTLIIAAFVPDVHVAGYIKLQGLVMFGLYAAGIISALLVALVFRLFAWANPGEAFIMELPSYKLPNLKSLSINLFQRGLVFLKRAGSTILAMMILVWFLASFPQAPLDATGPAIHYSFAGLLGHALEPWLAPIGFNWQIAVALIPGLAAREVAVGALATVYALGDNSERLGSILAVDWSLPTALAFLAWYVFAPQCLATLAVVRRETAGWKWPLIMFGYLMVLAYVAAGLTFHISQWLIKG